MAHVIMNADKFPDRRLASWQSAVRKLAVYFGPKAGRVEIHIQPMFQYESKDRRKTA